MLRFEDLAIGKQYRNKKNQKTYTIVRIGLHTEREDVEVFYEDSEGFPWFRPIGLFMLKFENVKNPHYENQLIHHLCQKYGHTLAVAQQIVSKYSSIFSSLDVDNEELAENLDFADKNHLTVGEWQTHIDMINKQLEESINNG